MRPPAFVPTSGPPASGILLFISVLFSDLSQQHVLMFAPCYIWGKRRNAVNIRHLAYSFSVILSEAIEKNRFFDSSAHLRIAGAQKMNCNLP
jgi:hypothetical protein